MATLLITGSNSGFGRLTALAAARQGHRVIATMRDVGKADQLRADAEAEGLTLELRQLDVCDPGSVGAALSDAIEIDVLVNNAAFEVQGALETVDDALMLRQLDTNVMGPLRTIRAVVPAWRRRGSGVVVNVSSVVAVAALPFGGAYAATKWALEGMSESLHYEVANAGIRVHLIQPGRFSATSFSDNIVRPASWEGSEHQVRSASLHESLAALDGEGPADPQLVADAILRAAVDGSTPFRTVVGHDGELIVPVKAAMSFEEFEATMRAHLDWHD